MYEVVVKDFHCIADVVAAGTHSKAKMAASTCETQVGNKLAHQRRRLPTMHREAKAYSFILGKVIRAFPRLHVVYFHQSFSGGIGQCLSHPAGVSCS